MKTDLLLLDLQLFADDDGLIDFDESDDDDADFDFDDDDDNEPGEPGDDSEFHALDDEDGEADNPDPNSDEPNDEPPAEPDKKVQTPEENAFYAEQRRQRQIEAELAKLKQESPEYRLAARLAEMSGTTPEEMLQQLEEKALQDQAEQQKIPVEVLRREKEMRDQIEQLKLQVTQSSFEAWKNRLESEKAQLKTSYPMLSDEDLTAAQTHMLSTLKNTDVPLEDVVFMLHGKKIAESQREVIRQELLAEMGGRKRGPVPPQGNKANSDAPVLTAEERHIAQQMGISEADYLKYRT